ncbi:MAG: Gfo/Idh/MocA family protein [Acidimicrobiales bacterium]
MPGVENRHGFGIVGCGVVAPTHVVAVAAQPDARLVAVTDNVPERAQAFAEEHRVEWHADLDELLARSDIDVVSVCVPSGMHAEIGARAAEAGKHVVVEKPIEITLGAADRLIDAARRAGVQLTVISQHRFDAGTKQLRALIDSGRLGRLVLGDAHVKWYRTQGYYDSGDWRGTWALDGGGALMNQGVHYVDLLRWMMGPVEQVTAICATESHEIEVEDTALALLRFSSGAVGLLEASTAVFPGFPERLEVSGIGGTVILEDGVLRQQEFLDDRGEVGAYGAKARVGDIASSSAAADPAAIQANAHALQLADFLRALDSGGTPLMTGAEARGALEIITAVYQSAAEGRPVMLPLAGS